MFRTRLLAAATTAVTASLLPFVPGVAAQATTGTGTAIAPVTSAQMPAGGVFSPGTAWRKDVRSAPVHENSPAMVQNVTDQVAKYYGGVAAFNAYSYSTSVYTVPANQPRVDVRWSNCQGWSWTPKDLLGPGGQFNQVPIPADAVPAKGTDSQLTIYSPSTDQLWEFWIAKQVDGQWSACWGGRIDGVSHSQGQFPGTFGASASGLAIAGGTIGIKDVQSGVIDHAIALHLPAPGTHTEVSWPATRSDGFDTSAGRVPEGTRLRLDPSLNVDALALHPIAKMVAKAAQKYGFVVTDTAGCVAVIAESPAAAIAATGVDPWKALMGATPDYAVMKNFPWAKLQALPADHGRAEAEAAAVQGATYVSDTAFRTVRNGWGPVERDRSNGGQAAGDGKTLTIGTTTYAKGLGVHAASEVVVPVGTA
ncbi:NPCBM/NEW2 domain-containing protein, partial [Kineococcus glutinatus]|uniref:NPCBM/NEW2 domain-containing protein n=1 Tax=Kineococcus glutinatus TaxID=1070872 RepID=UPI0031ECAD2A